tara:strand:- start:4214 stop:4489 length:276 start_codon:yes stop_codon:yes gene_type:complete
MSIEDVAERSDVWRDSIKHILDNVKAIAGAIIAAGIGIWAFWPNSAPEPTAPVTEEACVALLESLNDPSVRSWTEEQWSVFEQSQIALECD